MVIKWIVKKRYKHIVGKWKIKIISEISCKVKKLISDTRPIRGSL